ncbi:MAG: divergent polysaccharide deacetylase family protein [Pseudomonadota bacterium]
MSLDLHAPLAPSRKAKTGKTPRRSSAVVRKVIGLSVFGALIAGNLALQGVADPKPPTLVLDLPETNPAQAIIATGSITPAPPAERVENGVKIVYGTQEGNTSAPTQSSSTPELTTIEAPVPKERPDGATERLLSPGGAKIITLAPTNIPSVGQPIEVAHLPEDKALEELSDGLLLPRITPDGRRPMDIYARPWSENAGKRIAIMIGGIGLSQTSSQRAIDRLPPEITLGFSPAGNSLNRWMRAARKKGHELVLQVPMEPFNYPDVNPGPDTLRLKSTAQANIARLHTNMASITNYTGITNYLGARFMTDTNAVTPVFREVGQRGLLFFNDGTAKAPGLEDSARALAVPYVEADLVIDSARSPAEINVRLKALEDLATARGVAIGTGAALDLTIEAVAAWANDAKKRGFEIVGVSALAE